MGRVSLQKGATSPCTLHRHITKARWSDMRLIRFFKRTYGRNNVYIRRHRRIFSKRSGYRLRIMR